MGESVCVWGNKTMHGQRVSITELCASFTAIFMAKFSMMSYSMNNNSYRKYLSYKSYSYAVIYEEYCSQSKQYLQQNWKKVYYKKLFLILKVYTTIVILTECTLRINLKLDLKLHCYIHFLQWNGKYSLYICIHMKDHTLWLAFIKEFPIRKFPTFIDLNTSHNGNEMTCGLFIWA